MNVDDIRDPKLYESWTEEDLREHIKTLKGILRAKDGSKPEPTRDLLKSVLDPTNGNFLGTGLSLQEWLIAGRLRDFQESFVSQDRGEKKRRMKFLILMSVELVKIREVSRFSTAQAEAAIECVIEGDWQMLNTWAKGFTFEEDGPEAAARYGPLWARFRELCLEAFQTRPGAPPEPATVQN